MATTLLWRSIITKSKHETATMSVVRLQQQSDWRARQPVFRLRCVIGNRTDSYHHQLTLALASSDQTGEKANSEVYPRMQTAHQIS